MWDGKSRVRQETICLGAALLELFDALSVDANMGNCAALLRSSLSGLLAPQIYSDQNVPGNGIGRLSATAYITSLANRSYSTSKRILS